MLSKRTYRSFITIIGYDFENITYDAKYVRFKKSEKIRNI